MKKRIDSDEKYVLDLISSILDCQYEWQKMFPDLLGDVNRNGKARKLAVDGYFKMHNLIVEYREKQHYKMTPFMDKRMTISRVSRGEQRKIYDKRKQSWAISNGFRFLEVSYNEFELCSGKRLKRNKTNDLMVLQNKLTALLREENYVTFEN